MKEDFRKFFESIIYGRLKESEKNFDKIIVEEKIDSEKKRGYMKALEGLLLTLKSSDDKYLFFVRKSLDENNLEKLMEEFNDHVNDLLQSEYDRGYFSALLDYIKTVKKIKPWRIQSNHND